MAALSRGSKMGMGSDRRIFDSPQAWPLETFPKSWTRRKPLPRTKRLAPPSGCCTHSPRPPLRSSRWQVCVSDLGLWKISGCWADLKNGGSTAFRAQTYLCDAKQGLAVLLCLKSKLRCLPPVRVLGLGGEPYCTAGGTAADLSLRWGFSPRPKP